MNLIDWLRGTKDLLSPWADPSHLDAVTFAHLLDLPADQLPMTRDMAMSVPAVARGRNVLATTAARLPLIAQTAAGPLTSQPTIVSQPEVGRTKSQTILWAVDQLIFHGRAWWIIAERTPAGLPARVVAIPETAVRFDPAGNPTHALDRPVAARDWLRIDGPHEGLLTYGRATIRAALALEAAAARAARNPVPSIALKQTQPGNLAKSKIDELVAAWAKAREGVNGGVGFLSYGLEAEPLGQQPEQLLIEGRRQSALDLARLLGIPAWAVDAPVEGSALTYSNVPDRSRELIDFGLAPYLDALESRLSMDDVLPAGVWARFDTTDLLRGDLAQRAAAYTAAQTAGILTPEECRAIERGRPKE